MEARRKRIALRLLGKICVLEHPGREHLERYLREKIRRNCRATTLEATFLAGKLLLRVLKEVGKQGVEQLSRQDVEAFIEYEQDRGMSPQSVQTRLIAVKAFIHFLIKEGLVDPDVLSQKIRIRLPERLPRAMDPQDLKRLLQGIQDVRDRAMGLVLVRTGMRIGELLTIRVEEVNLKEQRILITEGEKNRIGRVVFLSEDARTALAAWMNQRDPDKPYLFYAQGRPAMGYAAARVRFNKWVAKAGLDPCGYTIHCLRHTFATEMLNAGMRLECLQQLLGHSRIEMTLRYARLTDRTREQEYFRAMEIIERGQPYGPYQLDRELQAILEEKKLLRPYHQELPEHPEAFPGVGGCAD